MALESSQGRRRQPAWLAAAGVGSRREGKTHEVHLGHQGWIQATCEWTQSTGAGRRAMASRCGHQYRLGCLGRLGHGPRGDGGRDHRRSSPRERRSLGRTRGGSHLAGWRRDEGRGRRCRLCHVEFSQVQIAADVGEGGERPLASDELGHELEALIEASQNIQHMGAVGDGFAKSSKSISFVLHRAAVVVDGESALGEIAEFSIEDQGLGFLISQELLLDPKPSHPSRDAGVLVDNVQDVGRYAVEQPGDDHAVHAWPCRIVEGRHIFQNVICQMELAESEENIAAPLGVQGRLELEDDGDQVLDVLNCRSLSVEVSDGRSIRGNGPIVIIMGVVAVGFSAETIAKGRDLLLQGVGGGADALLGSGSRRVQLGLPVELLAARRVDGVEGGVLIFQCLGSGEGFVAQPGGGGDGIGGGRGASHGGAQPSRGHARGSKGRARARQPTTRARTEERKREGEGTGPIGRLIPCE